MNPFSAAMRFVEEEHAFPSRGEDVHGRRFRVLLEEAGLASRLERMPTVVVAGSAGKASTARMIASIARASLDRAADPRPIVLGTKPPLSETPLGNLERYQILRPGLALPAEAERLGSAWARACWIDPDAFVEQVDALRPIVERLERRGLVFAPYDLRYAILARLAEREGAALAVIEANIGLRDDVAGQWPGTWSTVLTRIGTEHVSLLHAPVAVATEHPEVGSAIGPLWQKASGVARGAPVVLAPQEPLVEALAEALALEAGARDVVRVVERSSAANVRTALDGSRADLMLDGESFPIVLGALGDYQIENARTAAVSCAVLAREGLLPAPTTAEIAEGLRRVVVPGRLELVGREPATLLNVTEGASKVESLLRAMRGLGVRRFVVCASILARVDGADEVVSALVSAPETVAFLATSHGRGDLPAIELARRARRRAEVDVRCEPDARAAVALARSVAGPGGTVLLVGNGLADALGEQARR